MKALCIEAVNRLAVVEASDPRPAPGEVLVALRAAALNHRDLWIKRGEYAGCRYPCIPGSDGAGVVEAVGEGVEDGLVGREVIINPAFDWGPGEGAQGPAFSILGLPRSGTLAEKVAVPAVQLAERPAHLSWEESAALPLSGLTAWRAVCGRARLARGERILITGIGGGVALFALRIAVALGAEVWVTSGSAAKIAQAVALGARGGFEYSRPGWASEAAAGSRGFDVIVDSAGGDGFADLVDLAAPGGRIVFFGATRGNPPGLAMRKVFWRQLSLLGTTMGSPADWSALIDFAGRHQLRPGVARVFALQDGAAAFDLMESAGQFGKIVVRC